MKRRAFLAGLGVTAVAVACGDSDTGTTQATTPAALPDRITEIMQKPRYANASWRLLVRDVATGEEFYALEPDTMALTGSTRKLFSVGLALDTLGADHTITTPAYRTGSVDEQGRLDGDLVLVGSGDLVFGGRRIDANTVQYTDFDHNDANGLGTAILTPQDPLLGVNDLAQQVRAAGITSITGDIVVDDRLFTPYRVPNGNLLVTPIILNENMVDVTVTPTIPGAPARVEYRPHTEAFAVEASVTTTEPGTPSTVAISGEGRIQCIGAADCRGTVAGTIPADYRAPLSGATDFVRIFRVEDPAAFARTAFIEALENNGVTVTAAPVAPNPAPPQSPDYPPDTQVAAHVSAPFDQVARLVLKVSLNLGANLSLSLFGLTRDATTIEDALAAERDALAGEFDVPADQFDFPTNGSGTPDSQASPNALVTFLSALTNTDVADQFRTALPILGVDGSLAHTGTQLPGRGHVFAKTGTTIVPDAGGETLELKAQNLAGYIETASGRTVAYALMVNDAGPVTDLETDVSEVFEDEAAISSIIYETL
ncbi:MAG TPA: D-alanyl-D-alanine carboxypeptidase [Aldersonia sp.]